MKLIAFIISLLLTSPAIAAEVPTPGDNPSFIIIDPMIISILQGARNTGLMSVTVRLKLEEEGERAHVESLRPKLRDRYVVLLSRLASSSLEIDRPLNVPRLQKLLQRETDKVLGETKTLVLIIDASTRAL